MNSVIRSIRSPRRISDDQIEKAKDQVVSALLSNNEISDGEVIHTFGDVIQSVWESGTWNINSSSELLDSELKSIAFGFTDSVDEIKRILTEATENYAEKIAEKVALYNLEDGINHFVENLDVEEFQSLRGRV